MQTQAQLNPTPFNYPQSDEGVQFNQNFMNNGVLNDLKDMYIGENGVNEHEYQDEIAELNEREQLECELIRRLIASYFDIVREIVQDQVPKAIMCLLVNYIKVHIKLYTENYFDDLLREVKH